MFTLRKLRKHTERRLRDLPLPEEPSIGGLVANIEALRGQRIRLAPVPHCEDIRQACGLRARFGEDVTIILYRPRPTQSQTEHVILHEIVHEWLEHFTTLSTEELRELLPGEGLRRLVERYGREVTVQARARYGTVQEQEAELGAYLIEQRIARRRGPAGDDLVSRLEHTLSHPVAPPRGPRDQAH
ncbi:hypothetical protein [Streptomyces sp. ODS28]|uniref:hypothetical protein n=1 Tax=Streptomyces sp. ODS28 TaxID=3136688 RepID=UPI0031F171BC